MPRSEKAQQFHVRVWRGLWWNSLEHFSLENKLTSRVLEGFIVGIMEKKPFNLHYRITCDSKWQTRQAEITTTHGQERKRLSLVVDQKNRWLQDDHELTRVRGARDIDINMTPSTNMLPIKRLHLGPGKSGEITTAWDLIQPPMRAALAERSLTGEEIRTIIEPSRIEYPRLRGAAALVAAPIFAAPRLA